MIPKEQTRIGEGGNCFATALASILETPIPEFGFGDDYWRRVRAYLAKRGLAYKRVPLSQRPQGYSTVEGISPRGGLHACVAKDGKFVHDPHPISDDPRRGLAEPQYYGELMPLGSYRERLHRALDRAMDEQPKPLTNRVLTKEERALPKRTNTPQDRAAEAARKNRYHADRMRTFHKYLGVRDGLIPLPPTAEKRAVYEAALLDKVRKLKAGGTVRGLQPHDLDQAREQLKRLQVSKEHR
jgi:hypothetical protein